MSRRSGFREGGYGKGYGNGNGYGNEEKPKPKFIGGAERARREAQKRAREPLGFQNPKFHRQQHRSKNQRRRGSNNNNYHYNNNGKSEGFFHGDIVRPLSQTKLRSSERFFAALLDPLQYYPRGCNGNSSGNLSQKQQPQLQLQSQASASADTRAVLQRICLRLGLGLPPFRSNGNNNNNNNNNNSCIPHTEDPRQFFSSRAVLVMEESRFELTEALRKNNKAAAQESAAEFASESAAATRSGHGPKRKCARSKKDKRCSSWTDVRVLDCTRHPRNGFLMLALEKDGGSGSNSNNGSNSGSRFSPEEVYRQRPGSCFELEATVWSDHAQRGNNSESKSDRESNIDSDSEIKNNDDDNKDNKGKTNNEEANGKISNIGDSSSVYTDQQQKKRQEQQRERIVVRTIASVGPGRRGSTKLVLVVYDDASVATLENLWMMQQQQCGESGSSSVGIRVDIRVDIRIRIRFAATLISQCRQFEACDFGNSGHSQKGKQKKLLREIMGQKQATHIRFEYSDDDDNDDNEEGNDGTKNVSADDEEEEGTEEIVGYVIDDDDDDDDDYENNAQDYNNYKEQEYDNENDDPGSEWGDDCEVGNPTESDPSRRRQQQQQRSNSKPHLSLSSFRGLTSLNPTQEKAARAFCESFSDDESGSRNNNNKRNLLQLVQGPPGTGKTTFVVSVLARLLCSSSSSSCSRNGKRRHRRILVTAPTNKAVGVLAKRFLESCPGLLDDHGIPVVLIGVEDKLLEAAEDSGPKSDSDSKSKQNSNSIATASASRGSTTPRNQPESSSSSGSFADNSRLRSIFCYTWIASIVEEYDRLLTLLQSLHESLSLPVIAASTKSVSPASDRQLAAWLPRVFPVSSDSFMVHSDSDSDTDVDIDVDVDVDVDDESNKAACSKERDRFPSQNAASDLRAKARSLHVRLVTNLPRLSESSGAANLSRRLIRCLAEGSAESLSKARSDLRELLAVLRDETPETSGLDDDDENGQGSGQASASLESEAVPELLATARIVFCTLSTAGTSLMKQTRRVDDWIVDEAAAATEAELLIPLHLDPKRLLAVGDPMQLPASVASPLASEWGLGRSLHERLTVDLGRSQTMLDVQYRMKPEISEFPSHRFYDGRLTNGDNVSCANYGSSNPAVHSFGEKKGSGTGSRQLLHSTPPWCFFQVDGTERQSHSGSYYNIEEASAVVAFLKLIRSRSSSDAGNSRGPRRHCSAWCSPERIRIITFYTAQVATLNQMLRREGMPDVLVATVDSSQGCEADTVILSFVRTYRAGFLADDRRMNVALTRAKHKLIGLGNAKHCASWAASGCGSVTLASLVESSRKRGCLSWALATHE